MLLTLLSVLLVSLAVAGAVAYAQLLPAPQQPQPAAAQPAAHMAGAVSWSSLNQEQKTALRPLANLWPTLGGEHQRKWIALAHNFNRMSSAEQTTLQGRMTEWVKLTPAQRTQARLNFGETRKLPIDDKKARWEEYQSLTPEQRQRLAADRPKPPKSTAPALRPVPPEKILRPQQASQPGTAKVPLPANRNTLLPRPPASAPASAGR
ncbi:DUF3106 domain-containing protein [Ottowia sp.]|uniref:DUF3106 domain-containing protein n=1 Tax=Ottowia sp. TaxID=1898956 RepID=UPI003C728DA5